MISLYEIYKQIVGLPGDIAELGVYKGCSAIRLATFRNMLENDNKRRLILFDSFGSFPRENVEGNHDNNYISRFENDGGDGFDSDQIQMIFDRKGFNNISLIKGNVFSTVPNFLENNPHIRFSLIHFDLDVYEPTIFALRSLWDHVVPGGIFVFDDYNGFPGATTAVEEFMRNKNIEKISIGKYSKSPSYLIKSAI